MRKLLTAVLVVVGMNLPPVIATPKMFSIAHVGTMASGYSSGSCVGTIATSATTFTAGNLLVAHVWHGGTSATITVTSTNNTWHSTAQGFGAREAAYAYNAVGGSDTVTATWSGTRTGCAISVDEFSGFGGSNPFENNGVNSTGTGSPMTTGTVTITNPAVISAGMENGSSITGSSSTTCATAGGSGGGPFFSGCYKIVSSNDAATATSGGATSWLSEGASYTAAGGGSTFPAAIINSPLRGGGRRIR